MKLVVINGANLNMLGVRQRSVYGEKTLDNLMDRLVSYTKNKDIDIEFFQSNIEGDIVSRIQQCYFDKVDGIIINAGAFSHYSYAIYDALKAVDIPAVEVHISNIYARSEEFRHNSVLSSACIGVIAGLGFYGYKSAISYLAENLDRSDD